MEATLCKHFQVGFCKFGDHCRKHHVKEICQIMMCKSVSCRERHPKLCKYFSTFKTCKFGEHCAYQHIESKESSDIQELVSKLAILENTIRIMSVKIENIEEKLGKEIKANSSSNFQCDQCNFTASSSTVLKSHTKERHESMNYSTPEKERSTNYEVSLQFSPSFEERDEDLIVSTSPVNSTPHPNTTTYDSKDDDEVVSDDNMENEIMHISQKVAFNTLSTNILTCDDCGANFPDEAELYDEHFWFNHRESVCVLKYSGCLTKPSENPHPFNQWYVACDNCWSHHLESCPEILKFSPRKPSGFKSFMF